MSVNEKTVLRIGGGIAALILLAGALSPAEATTRWSIASGVWLDGATWSGGVTPAPGDTVVISSGTTVAYDRAQPITINALTIEYDAILTASKNKDLYVNCDLVNHGTLRRPKGAEIRAGNMTNSGTVDQMDGAMLTVTGKLTNSATINFDYSTPGALNITGTAGLDNTGTITMGAATLTITNSGAFTNNGIMTSTSGNMSFPADVTNDAGHTFGTTSGTVTVSGSFTNLGNVTFGPTSMLTIRGAGKSTISSGASFSLGGLTLNKTNASDTVTTNSALNLTYTAGAALTLTQGVLFTNNQNLSVNADAASEIQGGSAGGLAISGGTVNISRLNQSSGLAVSMSGSPTVTILWHGVGGNGRCEISSGAVTYSGTTSQLALTTASGAGGWFATDGTITFNGSISGTTSTVFQATGSAVVVFAGGNDATVTLHNSGVPVSATWAFNDLRVEKTGNARVTFGSGLGALSGSVTASAGVAVNAGAVLALGGTFGAGQGYVLAGMDNNGAVTQGADIYVSGDWTGTGTFTHGSRAVVFDGSGARVLAPGGQPFYDVTVNKSPGSLTLAGNLGVARNLTVSSGTLFVGDKTLTLGTGSESGGVMVNGGTFSIIGSSYADGLVSAAAAGFPYSFNATSGTIAARQATFQYMGTGGISIASGASVDATDNFSNCNFDHGSADGPMLKIENGHTIDDMLNVSFSGTAGDNIEKLGAAGHITVSYGSGSRWGEAYDNDPNNRIDWVTLVRHDVGVTAVLVPTDTVGENTVVFPRVTVRNYGGAAEDFNVRVIIDDGVGLPEFEAAEQVTGLGVGEIRSFEFSANSWIATPQALYHVIARSELGGDDDPVNDTAKKDFRVVLEKPAAFSLIRPANGAGDQPIAETLYWSASARAAGYYVLLDLVNPPAETVSRNQPDTFYAYSGLRDGRDYYWKVVARNAGGETGSTVWTFTTMAAPGMPVLVSPAPGATGQPVSGQLAWQAASGAAGYDVYLDVVNPPVNVVSPNQPGVFYSYSGLDNGREYFWKVVAKNAGGSASSGVWNFTTVVARPGPFDLSTPENNAVNVPVAGNLTWTPSAGATVYDVYLNLNPNPTTKIGSDVLDTLYAYTTHVTTAKKYYWRVAAKNTSPDGRLCNATFNFTTEEASSANDVGVTFINAPVGTLDTAEVVLPQATVTNFGPVAVSFKAFFRISDGTEAVVYRESTRVNNLAPGYSFLATFAEWAKPHAPGSYATRCSTYIPADGDPGNDTKNGSFIILAPVDYDAGVTRINEPVGTIDTSTVVMPRATVRNFGTQPASFKAFFEIDDGTDGIVYSQSVDINNLAPGRTYQAVFPTWAKPHAVGNYATRCSTYLAADENPANDVAEDNFEVAAGAALDVGVSSIIAPVGLVRLGTAVAPVVTLRNYTRNSTSCNLRLVIGTATPSYDTIEHDVLVPAQASLVYAFAKRWTAAPAGNYTVTAYTILESDTSHANDTARTTCRVSLGGWEEMRPMPGLPTGKPVKDGGWLAVGPDKRSGVRGVPSGGTLCCRTARSSNSPVGLNQGSGSGHSNPRSALLAQVPSDGSTLEPLNPSDVIYAVKGYKTADFFKYVPTEGDSGTWHTLKSIPPEEGAKTKLPSKGCVGVSDGENFVYMTKGNNTLGFRRYNIAEDTWELLPGVPEGPNRKKVKGGTDMVYAVYKDTGCVFLLKGYKTEFYRYNPEAERWDTLSVAPSGGGKAKYDKGSFLVYDQAGHIYAHQAKYYDKTAAVRYHYMFRYDLETGRWADTLKGMPLAGWHGGKPGKNKKSKDGGAGDWYANKLYAVKGGNTQQFFRYFPQGDSWQELDTVPGNGSANKKKRVKQGADLVSWGGGTFFALKGNKTYEFWRYTVPMTAHGLPPTANSRSGVMAGNVEVRTSKFELFPNPIANGFATLRFVRAASQPRVVTVGVYDVAGRCVLARPFVIRHSTLDIPLDLRKLSSGVYLVRLDADNYTATQKLVVQR